MSTRQARHVIDEKDVREALRRFKLQFPAMLAEAIAAGALGDAVVVDDGAGGFEFVFDEDGNQIFA